MRKEKIVSPPYMHLCVTQRSLSLRTGGPGLLYCCLANLQASKEISALEIHLHLLIVEDRDDLALLLPILLHQTNVSEDYR